MSLSAETFAASLDAFDRWVALNEALSLDVRNLSQLLEDQPGCQTLRRAYVRGAWGFKEGSTSAFTLAAMPFLLWSAQ